MGLLQSIDWPGRHAWCGPARATTGMLQCARSLCQPSYFANSRKWASVPSDAPLLGHDVSPTTETYLLVRLTCNYSKKNLPYRSAVTALHDRAPPRRLGDRTSTLLTGIYTAPKCSSRFSPLFTTHPSRGGPLQRTDPSRPSPPNLSLLTRVVVEATAAGQHGEKGAGKEKEGEG
jgi:hypothetical protein